MDVDSTLIDEEVIDELGDAAGVGERIADVTARAMHGELDFAEALHARVALLKGLPASRLDDVYARLHFTNGALTLIERLHAHGWKVGVVSGGYHEIVDRLAREAGLDYWIANRLAVIEPIRPSEPVAHTSCWSTGVCARIMEKFMVRLSQRFSTIERMSVQPLQVLDDMPTLCTPGLLVMDVDSTLIDEEVIDELGDAAGVGERIADVTARAMHGELDFAEALHARVALLKGLPASRLDDVYARLHFTNGALTLIERLHAHGWKVGVVSGGYHEIVDRLAREAGLDYWIANRLGQYHATGTLRDRHARRHRHRTERHERLQTAGDARVGTAQRD